MANIIVYGSAMGTSFRVHWMLKEIGLPYETKKVDFAAGEHKSPAYLAMNPAGQVPLITIDGFALPESLAITQYLAQKFAPALLGSSPEDAAQMLRWSLWNMFNLNSAMSSLASVTWTKQELAPEVKTANMETLAKQLPILEQQLAGKEYLLGTFSLADINVRSSFTYGEAVNVDFSAYPNLQAWLKRTAERPSFLAARS